MKIIRMNLKDFTVFSEQQIDFDKGINVLIGENGVGKTHLMKLAYAATQATKRGTPFARKIVNVFEPIDLKIGRLVRTGSDIKATSVCVASEDTELTISFSKTTQKAENADVRNEDTWEECAQKVNSIYIPAKEILSNSWNLDNAVKVGNVEFDDTYLDVIAAARIKNLESEKDIDFEQIMKILSKIDMGKVQIQDEHFYLKSGNKNLEFTLVSEGIRKIALLTQLIANRALRKEDILFWDEPEANINPKFIPVIAEMLVELERQGVQIFISTHDYFLAKYIEVKKTATTSIKYISLYRDEKQAVLVEKAPDFTALSHNSIMQTFRNLYYEEIGVEND